MTAIAIVLVIKFFCGTRYLKYMYKKDLALDNQQELIYHKTLLN